MRMLIQDLMGDFYHPLYLSDDNNDRKNNNDDRSKARDANCVGNAIVHQGEEGRRNEREGEWGMKTKEEYGE